MMRLLLNSLFGVTRSFIAPLLANILKLLFPIIMGSAVILLIMMLVFRVLTYFGIERDGFRLSYGAIRMLRAMINGAIAATFTSDLELEREKQNIQEEEERRRDEDLKKKMALKMLENPKFQEQVNEKITEAGQKEGGMTAFGMWMARQIGVKPTDVISYFGRRQ